MSEKPDVFESEKTLHILKELEVNSCATQRNLSQKLAVSLGKTNFLLNALIDKGLIKIEKFKNKKDKLAYMYILTPSGIKAKFELTAKFIKRKSEEYEALVKELEQLKKEAASMGIVSKE